MGTAERSGGVSLLVGVVSRTAGALVDAGPYARVVVCCPSSLPGGRGVDTHAPETVAGPVQQRGVGWMSCSVAARKQGGALLYRLYIYIFCVLSVKVHLHMRATIRPRKFVSHVKLIGVITMVFPPKT